MPPHNTHSTPTVAGSADSADRANARPAATLTSAPASLLRSVAVAATLLVSTSSAIAATDSLEEIIVTAQRREQSLQSVGVSVTALGADDLRMLNITDTLKLGAELPGVQLNSSSGGNYVSFLTIRGVAQNDFSPQQESPNSMYIDDVYVSAPNAQGGQMFDVQRVEALRGPQGTLFGRNSTGGLLNFITNKPTKEFDGYVNVTGGEFNEFSVEAAVGGPISDRIRGRVAFLSKNNSGYDKQLLAGGPPDANTENFRGARVGIEADVTEKLTALFTLSFSNDNNREGFYGHINSYFDPANSGRPSPLPANVDAWGTGPGNDLQGYRPPALGAQGEYNFLGTLHRGILTPTVRLTWDLGSGATLTAISSLTKLHVNYDETCAAAPQDTCHDPYKQDLTQWSHEIRVNGTSGALTWVTGIYALTTDQHNTGAWYEPYYAGTPYAYDTYNPLHQQLSSQSLFGQVEYMFSPEWRGILGLRVTHDKKELDSKTYINEIGDFTPGGGSTVYSPPYLLYDFSKATVGDFAVEDHTNWSGKVELDRVFSKSALLYASIARGIKGAGFNSNLTGGTTLENTPIRAEHMTAYEIGEKVEFLDNRVRINSSVFYYNYKDFQTFQSLISTAPFVTNNDAHFSGGEIELFARPATGLEVRLAVAELATTIKDVHTAQVGVVDQQAPDAPKWSGNALVRYSWPVKTGTASVQWNADYVGSRFHSADNSPIFLIPSSIGHNLRIGYATGRWDFSIWSNNVLNAVRQTGRYDVTGVGGYAIASLMPPRWTGATVRYQF